MTRRETLRHCSSFLLMLAAMAIATTVRAQSAPLDKPASLRDDPDAFALPDAERTHDGFYLRIGLGIPAAARNQMQSDDLEACSSPGACARASIEGTMTGYGPATELAAGWAVSRGVVVGLGLYSHVYLAGASNDLGFGALDYATVEYDLSVLALAGPFCDLYFSATGGTHAQLGAGLAWSSVGEGAESGSDQRFRSLSGVGPGVMVGVGYEAWVGPQWAAGFLLRATAASVRGEDGAGVAWQQRIVSPALLLTTTYN